MPESEFVQIVSGVIKISHVAALRTLQVVANPLHPKNRWKSVIEKIEFGGETYLRLVTEIPLGLKIAWEKQGHPPPMNVTFCDEGSFVQRSGKDAVNQIVKRMVEGSDE